MGILMVKDNGDQQIRDKHRKYDCVYAKVHEKAQPENYWGFRTIFNLYEPMEGDNVLDIGCNTGEFCYLLTKKCNVISKGIDVNQDAIFIAKHKYLKLDFEAKSLFGVNDKERYDAVYMLHVIEHLEKPEKALGKIRGLLRENGKLVIVCPNKWAFVLKFTYWIRGEKFCYDPTHLYEFSPYSIRKILKEHDFKVKKIVTKPLGVPFLKYVSQNIAENFPAFLFGGYIFILAEKA